MSSNIAELRTIPHFCHALNCQVEIANDVFFCAKHFEQLPQKMRQEVSAVQKFGINWREREGKEYSIVVTKAVDWLKRQGE